MKQRQHWEEQVAALDGQLVAARGQAERTLAELEWAQTRVGQLERERGWMVGGENASRAESAADE